MASCYFRKLQPPFALRIWVKVHMGPAPRPWYIGTKIGARSCWWVVVARLVSISLEVN